MNRVKVGAYLIALFALTTAYANPCSSTGSYNEVTGLDVVTKDGKKVQPGEEPTIHALDVDPHEEMVVLVGERIEFLVRALDSSGTPMPDTEGAIYVGSYDEEVVEFALACGGNDNGFTRAGDDDLPECQESNVSLTPAHHGYDNDGILKVFFDALAPGTTTLWFSYPGPPEGIVVCTGDCSKPAPATHVVEVSVTVVTEEGEDGDYDGDGWTDAEDNCPRTPNADQLDSDGDGYGDVCDNCAGTSNPGQEDGDGDGIGDTCDNCKARSNADQADGDGDGVGDVCDNCKTTPNADQLDADGDFIGDACDNCPTVENVGQQDADHDGIGDACEGTLEYVNLSPRNIQTIKRLEDGGTEAFSDFIVPGDHQSDGSGTLQGFVEYDLSSIPTNMVASAKIYVTRNAIYDEGNPFSSLGGLYVETSSSKATLNEGPPYMDAVLISNDPFTGKSVDVTELVHGHPHDTLVLRFRFSKPESNPDNGINDNIDLTVGGLEVEYYD